MPYRGRTLINYLIFFLTTTQGEIVNWCGTSQSKLRHFKPQTQLAASSEMHCVILLLTHKETDWLSQTAEYTDGLCTLYGEIVESQGCSDNTKTGYWSRDVSNILFSFDGKLCNYNISLIILLHNSKCRIIWYVHIISTQERIDKASKNCTRNKIT